jgi:GntR family transcriptional regulator of arabinose operon
MPVIDIKRKKLTPIYYQVGEQIKHQIEKGILKPDEQFPPEDIFAEKLEISRKTLRFALDKLAKEGYINRIKGKGTFVSSLYKKHRVLATVVNNRNFSGKSRTVNELLSGVMFNTCSSDHELRVIPLSQAQRFIETYKACRDDVLGMIFLRYDEEMESSLKFAKKAGITNIIEGATLRDTNYVDINNTKPMEQAVKYLAELGHRKIGLVSCISPHPHFNIRTRSVLSTISEMGLPFKDHWLLSPEVYNSESIHASFETALQSHDQPTAFVMVSDVLAISFIKYARRRGISVPRDFSVIGFDDIAGVDLMDPPLTTFRQDYHQNGFVASATILELLKTFDNKKRQIVIDPEFIIRESCAKPRGDKNCRKPKGEKSIIKEV